MTLVQGNHTSVCRAVRVRIMNAIRVRGYAQMSMHIKTAHVALRWSARALAPDTFAMHYNFLHQPYGYAHVCLRSFCVCL